MWIAISASLLLGVGCKKDKEFIEENYAQDTLTVPASISYDGLMVGVRVFERTESSQGVEGLEDKDIVHNLALAEFGTPNFTDVGNVKLNDVELSKIPTNQYVSAVDGSKFKFQEGGKNKWRITGGQGFESITYTMNSKMPGLVKLEDVAESISKQSAVTFKIQSMPAHAQALIWTLRDAEGNHIQKESNESEITFTAENLSKISSGRYNLLKVVAYSMDTQNHGNKTLVFMNQTVDMRYLSVN